MLNLNLVKNPIIYDTESWFQARLSCLEQGGLNIFERSMPVECIGASQKQNKNSTKQNIELSYP